MQTTERKSAVKVWAKYGLFAGLYKGEHVVRHLPSCQWKISLNRLREYVAWLGYNGFSFFLLFPFYCLTDVRVAGETPMAILCQTIPTCLPDNNQFRIGQNNCLCLQIVWHPSRRRTTGGVLGYPERNIVAHGQARAKIALEDNRLLQCSLPSRTFQ